MFCEHLRIKDKKVRVAVWQESESGSVTRSTQMAESDPIREILVSQDCLQSEELQTEQNAAIDKVEKLIGTWEGRLVSSEDLKSECEKYCKLVCIGSHKLGVHL